MKRSSSQTDNETDFEPVFDCLSHKKADLIVLILASQGIKFLARKTKNGFQISVPLSHVPSARNAVATYFRENRKSSHDQPADHLPLSSFQSPAAFFIMGLITLIHAFIVHFNAQEKMILEYGASALYILQGQTFRAITALFLHADLQHLFGNLAGLLIFAAPVISVSGYGTGPFMLLFAGTSGNLLNALLYRTAHLSIGSSTAVMGAAGLLAAYQMTRKQNRGNLNAFMPVFAGAILVGMFSHGERTDVWAHIFGFLCGLFSGLLFFPLNRVLKFRHKETAFLILTSILVCSAFFLKPA